MTIEIDPDRVRDGLFLAASRTYAEQYVEPIIRRKFDLLEPTSADHDAIGPDGVLYEIKASKVMRRRNNRKGSRTLLGRVLYEVEDTPLNRYFDSSDRHFEDYDANIQNVKRDHFDVLIYTLMFKDCLMVFSAPTEDIKTGTFSKWSDKHGRYDAVGKSGQFPIDKSNITWHEENYFECSIDYGEVTRLLGMG